VDRLYQECFDHSFAAERPIEHFVSACPKFCQSFISGLEGQPQDHHGVCSVAASQSLSAPHDERRSPPIASPGPVESL
jgi:hypothetical protein